MKSNLLFKILFCLILFTSEIRACSSIEGSNIIQENQTRTFEYIAISFVLFALTVFLYFKKSRKGILPVVICFIIVGLTFLTSTVYVGDCGQIAVENARQGVLITFICFSFQFFTWLFRKKKVELF